MTSTQADSSAAVYRETARTQWRRGELDQAEQSFDRLLALEPEDTQALQFVADRHYARGDADRAGQLLQTAARLSPDDPAIARQLGAARLATGDYTGAIAGFQHALERAPQMFVARLNLGIALEQSGRAHDALIAYAMAIHTAQGVGRWQSDATTAPGLRDAVRHAIRYFNDGRHELFARLLDTLGERYGRTELGRVKRALAIYLGELAANLPDPRQQPKFLYFPDVPSQPYYPRGRFPWLDALEAAVDTVRGELRDVLQQNQPLEPFLGVQTPAEVAAMLRASGQQTAAWDAYFFYRHGDRYDDHCAQCPQTSVLLDSLPLVRVKDHAPETLFSVLRPGTHILPHRGVTNTRLVTHLPLIVPADCALRVGGEEHVWQEGHCVVFDDTFEHEAWNRGDQTRVVLILDTWNPDLSEAECGAITDLVEAIGDFNRTCEVVTPTG